MFCRFLTQYRAPSSVLCHTRNVVPTQAQNTARQDSKRIDKTTTCLLPRRARESHTASISSHHTPLDGCFQELSSPLLPSSKNVTFLSLVRRLLVRRSMASARAEWARIKSIAAKEDRQYNASVAKERITSRQTARAERQRQARLEPKVNVDNRTKRRRKQKFEKAARLHEKNSRRQKKKTKKR